MLLWPRLPASFSFVQCLPLPLAVASAPFCLTKGKGARGRLRSLPFRALTPAPPQDVLTLSSSTESEGDSGASRKPAAGQTAAPAVDSDDIQTISSGSEGDDFEDKKNMSGSREGFGAIAGAIAKSGSRIFKGS